MVTITDASTGEIIPPHTPETIHPHIPTPGTGGVSSTDYRRSTANPAAKVAALTLALALLAQASEAARHGSTVIVSNEEDPSTIGIIVGSVAAGVLIGGLAAYYLYLTRCCGAFNQKNNPNHDVELAPRQPNTPLRSSH